MSRTPYNPTLHSQIPRFIEGDESGRFREWSDWLKKVLMKGEMLNSIPEKIAIRNQADIRTWSWIVKGYASNFPVSVDLWKCILEVLPETAPWDTKIQAGEPWLLTVLSGDVVCDSGLPSWIEASLEKRKNLPEIKALQNTTTPFSIEIETSVNEIGQKILDAWVISLKDFMGGRRIDTPHLLFNRWTSLVDKWSKEMVIPDGRWMVQARHAAKVRELLISEELKPELSPLEKELQTYFSSIPDYPVFERLFWQTHQNPQWYATFEVSLAICGRSPRMDPIHATLWFDTLNNMAQERSKAGPHLLPVGEKLWTQLQKSLTIEQQPLWERIWLNARISSEVSQPLTRAKRL